MNAWKHQHTDEWIHRDCKLAHALKHRLQTRQNPCKALKNTQGEKSKEWMRNETKNAGWNTREVEGMRGRDKGREVKSGKRCWETEMMWRIEREKGWVRQREHNGEEIETETCRKSKRDKNTPEWYHLLQAGVLDSYNNICSHLNAVQQQFRPFF